MSGRSTGAGFASPMVMLLSAGIFGYFGWAVTWITTGTGGQFLLFVAILEWTLKISSIAFLASALLTMASPMVGNLVYSAVGLLGALAFAVVLVLDLLDTQHMSLHPILLAIFAVWNGYGAVTGLREMAAVRPGGSAGFDR